MTQRRKYILLLLLTAALLSLFLLSSSLSNLQLQAGVPFPAASPQHAIQGAASRQGRAFSISFLQALLGLLLLLLMIYIPARLILSLKSRWLLRGIQVLAILLIVAFLLSFINFDTGCSSGDCAGAGIAPLVPAPVSSAEGPTLGFMRWIGIGIALAASLLLFNLFMRLRRLSRQDAVLQHAEEAVEAIRSGKDLKNVVIRCYWQMAAALREENGIERDASMTSREFEHLLESRGFPPAPVHELTRLFERVRYSREELSGSDEGSAVESLSEIIRYARGGRHA